MTSHHAPAAHVDRYVAAGYPAALDLTEDAFRAQLAPLVDPDLPATYDAATGRIPSLLVLRHDRVSAEHAMSHVAVRAARGIVDMNPTTPATFSDIAGLTRPAATAYVLHDFDPGDNFRNEPPSAVLPQLTAAGRSPLVIDEALSALVLHPELLADKHAFSILASRSTAQGVAKSVPAVWISRGAPRLGWCWNDNPHTWLGSGSCASRWVPTG